METIRDIWSFFVMTSGWFEGMWEGWFSFFKGIIPWYANLSFVLQIILAIFYFAAGIIIVGATGWVHYEKPSAKKWEKITQDILYNLLVASVFPALFVVAFMISIPLFPYILFYGIWLMVWMLVILLALCYCIFIWPLTLLF